MTSHELVGVILSIKIENGSEDFAKKSTTRHMTPLGSSTIGIATSKIDKLIGMFEHNCLIKNI